MTGAIGYAKLAAAAGSMVVFAAGGSLPAWAIAGLLAGVLALLVVVESVDRSPLADA
jgi:hypothetical protein